MFEIVHSFFLLRFFSGVICCYNVMYVYPSLYLLLYCANFVGLTLFCEFWNDFVVIHPPVHACLSHCEGCRLMHIYVAATCVQESSHGVLSAPLLLPPNA